MKNPLHYQLTEYDCGPTSLLNAISFLFEREEIPPEVIRNIMLYCLDCYGAEGAPGKSGTSCTAMMFLSNWLTQFGQMKNFPISCSFFSKDDVILSENSRFISALQQGGVVLLRVYLEVPHYILLTGISGNDIYVFDPYYEELDDPELDKEFFEDGITFITDQPKRANRLISIERLSNTGVGFYEMGPYEEREAVILFNTNTRKTPENSIEYII